MDDVVVYTIRSYPYLLAAYRELEKPEVQYHPGTTRKFPEGPRRDPRAMSTHKTSLQECS